MNSVADVQLDPKTAKTHKLGKIETVELVYYIKEKSMIKVQFYSLLIGAFSALRKSAFSAHQGEQR
ncbi:MAG: hypothetical protein HRT89_14055 [Lentisphaeria bacterium]|nr:hypothetical protein [Lentisphaeria bacterium]NQZ69179.1 hypothetical protein [Lentisphaeria bacterium]